MKPLFAGLLLLSLVANSEITDADEKFALLCEVEKSTGFHWKKRDWHQANFITGQKYIIKKHSKSLNINSPEYISYGSKSERCKYGQEKDYISTGYLKTDGCYSIKIFGEKDKWSSYGLCKEHWDKDEQSNLSLSQINCDTLTTGSWKISPNEWFHKSMVHSSLEANPKGFKGDGIISGIPDDYKDSLSLTVGKCSEI